MVFENKIVEILGPSSNSTNFPDDLFLGSFVFYAGNDFTMGGELEAVKGDRQ